MIFIDLFNNPPPQGLIDRGKDLTEKMRSLTEEERKNFINNNAGYWGDLKPYYGSLSHGKCWYTEARDNSSHYQMDHFRPKNSISELTKNCDIKTSNRSEPYWWLAFEWGNYRYSSQVPNTSKHTYFPLRIGTKAANEFENVDTEENALIDPTNAEDVSLLTFDIDGLAHPSNSDSESWDSQRAQISIRAYNLNYQGLKDGRLTIQNICKRLILKLEKKIKCASAAQTDELKNELKADIEELINELIEMMSPEAEFSAAAKKYIMDYQSDIIKQILKRVL